MFAFRAARKRAWPIVATLGIALTLGAAAPPGGNLPPAEQSIFGELINVNAAIGLIGRPAPYTQPDDGCTRPDPSGVGCITPRTEWALKEVDAAFGDVLKAVGCWDEHAWNPKSDHPRGKGCDYYVGPAGKFADEADQKTGWLIAWWLRMNKDALGVKYVIWQGTIWSAKRDDEGWRPYNGGGVYDPKDPVGGHFDHIHVSMIA